MKHHDELGREATKPQHEYKLTEEQWETLHEALASGYNAEYFDKALKVLGEIKSATKHLKG